MQVFKSYFKVLRKYIGFVFLYTGITCGVLAVLTATTDGTQTNYLTATAKFAVFDYDQSEESRSLIAYLEQTHERRELADDDKETIQDELYMRNVQNILRIPAGFSAALTDGSFSQTDGNSRNPAALEIITIPGSQAARLFEASTDNYLRIYKLYLQAGFSSKEAGERTADAIDRKIRVTLADGGEQSAHSMLYVFFNYFGWTLVAMLIACIGPVLLVFNKTELKNRIFCSSYKFTNLNLELFAGVIVTGLVILAAIIFLSAVMLRGAVFSAKGAWFCANTVCYLLVALALTFLVSKLTRRQEALSMIANVASLGMAFLCGIFVPVEYLGDGIVKAAHLLPAYWFNQANIRIDFMADGTGEILTCMGIQLLFAAAFALLGLAAAGRRTAAH